MGPPTDRCPSCGAEGLRSFYEQKQVPAHSVLMLPTREAALGYPRGDISLGFCEQCGFVTNTLFDPSLNAYSPEYEESQSFSPRFMRFARELAQRWIDTYDIRGKTVLEIGCGKASFLTLLCELGGNRGIGIDPSARPDRLEGGGADRVTLIQELYSDRHASLDADVILCRHTLEHIHPTGAFLRSVRQVIGERHDTIVLFELPDVLRVLEDLAFWDVYYEHCSYFTAGSLARLFRASGFEVVDLGLEFDGQYLTVDARPGRAGEQRSATLPLEDDLERTARAVNHFQNEQPRRAEEWRAQLQALVDAGKRTVIWGGGSKGVAYLNTLGVGDEILCAVDINPYMQGKFMAGTGHQIVAPADLARYRPDVVIVMNAIYRDEIEQELSRLGIEAEVQVT